MKRSPQKNDNRGFAIMYAFSAIMLITFIVMSLSKETLIDYRISTKSIERVKAYYAAHSGVEMSLLRIQIYRTALAKFGSMIQDPAQLAMLDMIWSMPLPWPPVLVGDEVSRIDQELVNDAISESLMDSSYLASIEDEGTKIDLNDLSSKSKAMRDATRNQILNLFLNKVNSDEDFRERYVGTDFEEIVNNIADWVDTDEESLNGGAESSVYSSAVSSDEELPPNRAFRTPQELRMVAGIDDELFDLLAPRVTVYGTKGINVNHASKEVLMSLSDQLTDELAAKIVARRSDPVLGPFSSAEAFINYCSAELGVTIEIEGENAIPIYTDSVYNFKITSQGISRGTIREIVAVVYDFDKVKERLVEYIQNEEPEDEDNSDDDENPNPTPSPTPSAEPQQQTGPKGRPRVVYWQVN